MRGAGLQGFTILHHGFDAKRIHGSGKSLGSAFGPPDDRHGQLLFSHPGIYIQHQVGAFDGFCAGGMSRVALLP